MIRGREEPGHPGKACRRALASEWASPSSRGGRQNPQSQGERGWKGEMWDPRPLNSGLATLMTVWMAKANQVDGLRFTEPSSCTGFRDHFGQTACSHGEMRHREGMSLCLRAPSKWVAEPGMDSRSSASTQASPLCTRRCNSDSTTFWKPRPSHGASLLLLAFTPRG